MQKSVVVTGGAGFLGSHLCEQLLSGGSSVICIDNLITGRQKNIVRLMTRKDFTFINKVLYLLCFLIIGKILIHFVVKKIL